MPRKPDNRIDEAQKLYEKGMKLVEIASQLNLSEGTVRSWKSRYKWNDNATLQKRNCNVAKEMNTVSKNEKAVERVIERREIINPNLNEKQRLFCLYFVKYRNNVKAYQKAYGCSYENACSHASAMRKNVYIQEEINRLMEEYREGIELDIKDLFQWYLDIARADINDFVDAKGCGIQIREKIDGTVISEISETGKGIKVKLNDRMKAMEWLAEHIGLADERQKNEIEHLKAQTKKIQSDMNEEKETPLLITFRKASEEHADRAERNDSE